MGRTTHTKTSNHHLSYFSTSQELQGTYSTNSWRNPSILYLYGGGAYWHQAAMPVMYKEISSKFHSGEIIDTASSISDISKYENLIKIRIFTLGDIVIYLRRGESFDYIGYNTSIHEQSFRKLKRNKFWTLLMFITIMHLTQSPLTIISYIPI